MVAKVAKSSTLKTTKTLEIALQLASRSCQRLWNFKNSTLKWLCRETRERGEVEPICESTRKLTFFCETWENVNRRGNVLIFQPSLAFLNSFLWLVNVLTKLWTIFCCMFDLAGKVLQLEKLKFKLSCWVERFKPINTSTPEGNFQKLLTNFTFVGLNFFISSLGNVWEESFKWHGRERKSSKCHLMHQTINPPRSSTVATFHKTFN